MMMEAHRSKRRDPKLPEAMVDEKIKVEGISEEVGESLFSILKAIKYFL